MTRLIDADDFFRVFSELAIEPYINAPTVDTDLSEYSDKLWKEAYERGHKRGHKEGYEQAILDGKTNFSRPHGEWMKIEAPSYTIIRCTCCGYKDNAIYIPNYCPNCGADMREREADNDK